MAAPRKRTVNNISENGKLKELKNKETLKSGRENGTVLSTLLEWDEYYTKVFAVCADKSSYLGYLRPLMILLEYSGHGIPWFIVTIVLLLSVHMVWHVEMLVNIIYGLVIDVVVITILKLAFRRARPAHNQDDMVGSVTSVDKFSFPSGHATRAAMLATFFILNVSDSRKHVIYVTFWSLCVCLSRVALGRHHMIDVMCGYIVASIFKLIHVMNNGREEAVKANADILLVFAFVSSPLISDDRVSLLYR